MSTSSLRDLYGMELRDLLSAEKQLLVAVSRMARSATAPFLRQALTNYARQANLHARRLEWMCEGLNASRRGKPCFGMEGIVGDVRARLMSDYSGDVLDAGITASG
ncbi:MAG: YciE/YciF ferroxidase family protein, partial [Gemmatimonadales bacterium]